MGKKKKVVSSEKLTKKQAIARVLLAITIIVICVILGVTEVKKCFDSIDRNDEVINQIRTDYKQYKKEKSKPENTTNDILNNDKHKNNTINTVEEY